MANVYPMPLRPSNAQKLLREWAQDPKRVFFTSHAKKRMREREITDTQVFRCLRLGVIVEGPSRTARGGLKLDVQVQSSGNVLRVAAELNLEEQVIVITTYIE